MLLEGRGFRQKGFEGRPFRIFNLAVLIARIQVFIEKVAEIYLIERVSFPLCARVFRYRHFIAGPVIHCHLGGGVLLRNLLQDGIFHQLLVQHVLKFQFVELEEFNFLEQRRRKGKPLAEP